MKSTHDIKLLSLKEFCNFSITDTRTVHTAFGRLEHIKKVVAPNNHLKKGMEKGNNK